MAGRQNAHPEWRFDTTEGQAAWAASYPYPPPGWAPNPPNPSGVFYHSLTPGYGENIAFNYGVLYPVGNAQNEWMRSYGHCMNIMNPDYNYMGAGKAQAADGSWFFTEEFSY